MAMADAMSARLDRVKEVARLVQQDAERDAASVDQTPCSPRGIGEQFGTAYATIAGLARAVEVLAEEVEGLTRTVNARTEHLA